MATETMFDMMNEGGKEVSEMSKMETVEIADMRRNEQLRSYAQESGPAGGANVADPEPGSEGVGLGEQASGLLPDAAFEDRAAMGRESALDSDIRAKEYGIETGDLIQSELETTSPPPSDEQSEITSRFEVIGHGSSLNLESGKEPRKRSFALIRDNVLGKDIEVSGGEQVPGLGRVRRITHGGKAGSGVEILSEPGRGPGNFVLSFDGRNDDDLLMGMTDAGQGMTISAPMVDIDSIGVDELSAMAGDMLMGGRDRFNNVEQASATPFSPAQQAVLGTPMANDFLAGQELLMQGQKDTDAEIDAALMGDMGFDAMDPAIAPEIGRGLAKFSEDPARAQKAVRYTTSTVVDDERAHVFEVYNGRPGEVFIYFPESKTGRTGSNAEIGQAV